MPQYMHQEKVKFPIFTDKVKETENTKKGWRRYSAKSCENKEFWAAKEKAWTYSFSFVAILYLWEHQESFQSLEAVVARVMGFTSGGRLWVSFHITGWKIADLEHTHQ